MATPHRRHAVPVCPCPVAANRGASRRTSAAAARRILASEGVFDSIVSLAGISVARSPTRPGRRSAGSTTSSPAGPTGRPTRR
jgi:hypothetical protein